MAYEVTATRKRPQAFDTLVGQEFVVSTITNAIEQHRIAHAYLFSGPRGVGKTTSARILAKALNCEKGPTAHPCGTCTHCREITAGNSIDVIEIDGASNTSVNDIRQIKDEVMFPPQSSRYKIYIIDEVHMLSISAFNALLKTIEEPPDYIIFIFATTELQKVPATIRSRCQQFHFQLIGLETIKSCLKQAADDLKVQADDDALFWIAKEATGSMRDAYTLFDQVVSFSGDHITLAGIKDKLGLVGVDQINQIVRDLLQGKTGNAIVSVQSLLQNGVSIEQCIKDFAQYYRTLLLLKQGITDEDILGLQSNSIPDEVKGGYSNEQLEAAVDLLLRLYRDVRYSLNPRFDLELAISRLGELPDMVSPVALVKRLTRLQNDLASGRVTVTAEQMAEAHQGPTQTAIIPPPVVVKKETPVPSPAPVPVQKRPFLFSDMSTLIASFSSDPIMKRIMEDIVAVSDEDGLTLTFTKTFSLDQAKGKKKDISDHIRQICAYDGSVNFAFRPPVEKQEPKREENETIGNIATLFQGEVVNEKERT